MAKALGIGGFFFRSRDRQVLAAWYETHLGVCEMWSQEAGATIFAPFRQESDYFAADKTWLLNLRIDDLDTLIAELRAAGIAVETRPAEWDTPETGRFARIHDPEGNPVELWEPAPAMRPEARGGAASAIRHSVVFRLKHPPGSPEEVRFLADATILAAIPGVQHFQRHRETSPKNDFRFGFSMQFADQAAYQAYNDHPDHVAFVRDRWIPEVEAFLEIDTVPV